MSDNYMAHLESRIQQLEGEVERLKQFNTELGNQFVQRGVQIAQHLDMIEKAKVRLEIAQGNHRRIVARNLDELATVYTPFDDVLADIAALEKGKS